MIKGAVLTTAAVGLGFLVGLAIGQKTRSAAESNVSADYQDGKIILVADVASSLKQGVNDLITDFLG